MAFLLKCLPVLIVYLIILFTRFDSIWNNTLLHTRRYSWYLYNLRYDIMTLSPQSANLHSKLLLNICVYPNRSPFAPLRLSSLRLHHRRCRLFVGGTDFKGISRAIITLNMSRPLKINYNFQSVWKHEMEYERSLAPKPFLENHINLWYLLLSLKIWSSDIQLHHTINFLA